MILARRQGLYFAATGTVSPIPGPGYTETILQGDADEFIAKLMTNTYPSISVGVDALSALDLGTDPMLILAPRYHVVAQSNLGSLLLLNPRKSVYAPDLSMKYPMACSQPLKTESK